ncbi:phage holin family protein [Notoacmeibacter ruber]|uniref:Phage holin family protein n=1 Tax=Notoacmeibacter ruber TaxID=2670375 RepID=A0A3L7JE39_9HYPH|nr:phage holin family protein [Notoacmeibacter ruber]RLQ88724.1 phage holin family protein [Notoacmeibacter ruber]
MSQPTEHSNDSRSVPDLIRALVDEVRALFQTEGRLIRSEINDKVSQVQVGGGEIAAGAICLLVSLFVLSQALVAALTKLLAAVFESDATPAAEAAAGSGWAAWAALIVGVFFAIVGIVLLNRGRSNLQAKNLVPERTADQVSRDAKLVKEQAR